MMINMSAVFSYHVTAFILVVLTSVPAEMVCLLIGEVVVDLLLFGVLAFYVTFS